MAKKLICNKCGKEFNIWDEQENFSIYRAMGYGTKYDGERVELNLCCDCMEKLIESCDISPIAQVPRQDNT